MNGKYVCNELVFNILMMEYEVIGRITGIGAKIGFIVE